MPTKSTIELFTLAALWGASFLFMRIGSPEFGPILFMALRTLTACIFLLPLLFLKRKSDQLKSHWKQVFIMSIFNTTLPFVLFGYAILTLPAGLTSVLNSTTPIFGALIAYFWLKDRISLMAFFGLLLSFIGVIVLTSENITTSDPQTTLPILAILAATLCYAIAANYTKVFLNNVHPLALAAGSQTSSSLLLIPVGLYFLPETFPSIEAIYSVITLGIFCTGVAYILLFKLIADVGPTKAMSVTYLIPVFGLLWGYLFLGETIDYIMIIGSSCILLGVALTTGILSKQNIKRLINTLNR